jgi:hypothetical protein
MEVVQFWRASPGLGLMATIVGGVEDHFKIRINVEFVGIAVTQPNGNRLSVAPLLPLGSTEFWTHLALPFSAGSLRLIILRSYCRGFPTHRSLSESNCLPRQIGLVAGRMSGVTSCTRV